MRRLVRVASNVLTLLAVLVFAGLAIGPHTGAYRTLTVLSGSMAPEIPAGSVVAVVPTDAAELTEGMVITYAIPVEDNRVVTHRVVEIIKGGERPIIQTKGDANDTRDAWVAQLDDGPVWSHRATIPYLGFGISFMRQPAVRRAAVLGTPLVFLLVTLLQIWGGGSSVTAPQPEPSGRARQRQRQKLSEAWLVDATSVRRRSRLGGVALQGGVVMLVLVAVISVTLVWARPAIGLFRSTVAAQHTIVSAQLGVPTGVQTTCSGNRIDVAWNAVADDLTAGYTVWRSTTGTAGPFQEVAVIAGATTTTHRENPLTASTSYSFQVRATRAGWSSAPSAATAAIPVAANRRC